MFHYFLLFFCSFLSFSTGIIVETGYGPIEGGEAENGKYLTFKRIPFAKPPLGKLRFQKPLPPEKWNKTLNAKEYGPACMSNSTETSSPQKWVDEDCLHVNIFTTDHCMKTKDCAVVYYIHGGGLNYDSAVMFDDQYLFKTFSSRDVVLVIPAFRLGIFSHFVVHNQSIAPHNLAVYDIIESLEFVNAEIANFGGKNNKVTILGHSFGGSMVSALTFSQHINKDHRLFQQGISMSAVDDFAPFEYLSNLTLLFAQKANCSPPHSLGANEKELYMLKCLQNIDGHELLRIQRKMEEDKYPQIAGMVQTEPLFGGKTWPEFLQNPKKIPFMLGNTIREMDNNESEYWPATSLHFQNFPEVVAKYQRERESKRIDLNHTEYTQQLFLDQRSRAIALTNVGAQVYYYEYSYPKHAAHTDDLHYIMGVHSFEKDENEEELSKVYPDLFMNFAKYGKPADNFEVTNLTTGSYYDVYWDNKIGRRPQMRENYEKKVMDYWFTEMKEFDNNITLRKIEKCEKVRGICNIPNLRMIKLDPPSVEYSYFFTVLLISILLFISGVLIGKYAFKPTNYYIQLDGENYEKFIEQNI